MRYVYLDQEYSLIDNELSVYGQLQRFNRHALPEHELKIRLNRFLFAKQAYDKQCVALSGGEKMRLSLCCLMVSDSTPDIIIADEPTNNLDLYNIETLTNMLNKYSGTLIVISHDSEFAQRLSLSKEIIL
ncbi:ATP-binding cassette domain-containing protein [Muribaculum intestinale]|uniref:ATP-binding cassette domain-containing protein n=1 Tax=Muribaculum intestinale TaxID=1796646 RepID=UPI00336C1F21